MNQLIERYVAAALEQLPDDRKEDIGREIRGAVDEMVEPRRVAGEPDDEAIRGVLAELAASYGDTRRYLIGPGWYPAYIEVLKRILGVALSLIPLLVIALDVLKDDGNLGDAIGGGINALFVVGVQILFWVTLAFVIAERTMGPDGPLARRERPWTVDDLPEASQARQIGLAETLVTVFTLAAFGIMAFVLHERALGTVINGIGGSADRLPLINPELGPGWVAAFYVLLAISIVAAVGRYVIGRWTRPMLYVAVLEAVLWTGYIVALAWSEPIINPVLAEQFDGVDADWWVAGGTANVTAAIVIIAINLQELREAWQGHRAFERRHLATDVAG
jgi:hypothetical protein